MQNYQIAIDLFWMNIKKAPQMCSWFIFSLGVENCKWIFHSFFFDYVIKVYIFFHWIWWVNTHKVSFLVLICFLIEEFFNLNVGYSIFASHYLLPYFVTRLFNKFVGASDCKILLVVLFFILLVPMLHNWGA